MTDDILRSNEGVGREQEEERKKNKRRKTESKDGRKKRSIEKKNK